jgi:hypothetical protein
MVSRALLQTVLKKLNELEPSMRLGGHSMGRATKELDDVMKAIEATIVDYATDCDTKPDWWTKEGGGLQVTGPAIFDANNSTLIVHDRSALSFEEKPILPLSSLEIALTPDNNREISPPPRRTKFGDGTFLACVGVALGVALGVVLARGSCWRQAFCLFFGQEARR